MSSDLQGLDPYQLATEINAATDRASTAPVMDHQREIVTNIYPLMTLIVESMGHRFKDVFERMELVEGTVAEYLTGAESMILPELAGRLQATMTIGLQLCNAIVERHLRTEAQMKEELTERGEEVPEDIPMPPELATLIHAFRQSAEISMEMVADVTAEEIDDEPEPEAKAAPKKKPAPKQTEPETIEVDAGVQQFIDGEVANG